MHKASFKRMSEFVDEYLDPKENLKILDAGSYNVNGTYKLLFENPNWQYFGLDMEAGPNVDIVVGRDYEWNIEEEYDVVISGQTLEHVKNTHKFMEAICKAVKPGGLICIIAPTVNNSTSIKEHKYPIDCWRILPDGMKFLLEEICQLDIIKIWKQEFDCIGIAKKLT